MYLGYRSFVGWFLWGRFCVGIIYHQSIMVAIVGAARPVLVVEYIPEHRLLLPPETQPRVSCSPAPCPGASLSLLPCLRVSPSLPPCHLTWRPSVSR